MTLEELKAQEPDLVSQIEQAATNAAQAQASADAVTAERKRLADIDSIAASIPDPQLVHDAKYGDNPCTPLASATWAQLPTEARASIRKNRTPQTFRR